MVRFTCYDRQARLGLTESHPELAGQYAERIRLASGSRWLRLGGKLAVGPEFE